MKKIILISTVILVCLSLASCIYRPTIQQGNIIKDCETSQLRTGLTEDQVVYLMGTPVLQNPFEPNRWYYVHTIKNGAKARRQRYIIVTFSQGVVVDIERSPKMIVHNH
jgi:outer membrane protein assembly factor BamE